MGKYSIKDYQKGYEKDQVRIGLEVAQNWVWPYAYNLEDLMELHAQPDFNPQTRHYCFLGDEMVGYMFSMIKPLEEGEIATAVLDFPRMMPGHEGAAELLVKKAFDILKEKGVTLVTGHLTTMCPDHIELAEKFDFKIDDWGFKVYYSYEMEWGKLDIVSDAAKEVDPERDLGECAKIASQWYKRPPDWCRSLLAEWHEEGIITHVCIREGSETIAACMAAPNSVRPSTAANYYIYAPDEGSLKPMLAKVVENCIDFGTQNLIADLIYDHRPFEPVYQQLGFKKVADWARCEKTLD
jgi:hypothetical protein